MEMRIPMKCTKFAICTTCYWERWISPKRIQTSNGTHSTSMMVGTTKVHNQRACEHFSNVQKWIMHNKCTLIGGTLQVHQPHMESILARPINISWMSRCSFYLVCFFKRTTDTPSCYQTGLIPRVSRPTDKTVFPFRFSLIKKRFSL